MDHKSRVRNAILFEDVDRPPFDLFDECGSLFTDGRYDPSLRLGLSLPEQIEARLRFHRELDTDLIFDAPVIGVGQSACRSSVAPELADRFELSGARFPVTACLWMPWPPRVAPRPGHSLREVDNVGFVIEWDNGLELPMFVETASGNPSGYDTLMKDREQWPLWKQVFTPSLAAFDYTLTDWLLEQTHGDVALYGTIICPFSLVAVLLGIEKGITVFLEDPEFARELMEFFSEASIEAGRDLIRHGVDTLRVGGAWTSLLGPETYRELVLPYHRRVAGALRAAGGLSLLHCCGHVCRMLEAYAEAGWDGLEPLTPPPLGDSELADAKRRVGNRVCLKGNLDPVHVMLEGDSDSVARAVRDCLAAGAPGGGYVFSVADCMAPGTPRAHMEIVAEIVHGHR
ncbi:MAG: hypothetical protein JW820_16380 [Spirochaetales bacterium]|nr:hypothetical protein [Spirochaetales bacterium]